MWSGRKWGGVARRTTSTWSITFLNASKPTYWRSLGTSTRSPTSDPLRVERLASRRSWKASAIATSLTFLSALRAWAAAPVPRPPQPIRPILSVSPPPAWTAGATARTAPAAADVFRKPRRVAPGFVGSVDIAGPFEWVGQGLPARSLSEGLSIPSLALRAGQRMDLELAHEQF